MFFLKPYNGQFETQINIIVVIFIVFNLIYYNFNNFQLNLSYINL